MKDLFGLINQCTVLALTSKLLASSYEMSVPESNLYRIRISEKREKKVGTVE